MASPSGPRATEEAAREALLAAYASSGLAVGQSNNRARLLRAAEGRRGWHRRAQRRRDAEASCAGAPG